MIAPAVARELLRGRAKTHSYCIRVKVPAAEREDAWELCRAALHYGGVEVCECCFAFPCEERRALVLEALRCCFGAEYLEAVDMPATTP